MTPNRPIRKVRHAKRVRYARMGYEIDMGKLIQRITFRTLDTVFGRVAEQMQRNFAAFIQAMREVAEAAKKLGKAIESKGDQ